MRKRLREGTLDDREIEVDLAEAKPALEILGPQGMEEMAEQLKGLFSQMGQTKRKTRKLKIGEALKLLVEEEAGKLVNEDEIRSAALANAENNGIVFLDEIDKVASRGEHGGAEVSRQGVQRDLLPLVEGTSVNTKYGMVKTDHILFIASGAFHLAKPSDLIPELQGRFPIRVELGSLSVADFEAILTSTHASLVRQYQELLATEGVTLEITPDGVRRLAQIAFDVNESTENIGARRLATVMERLLDEVSFDAPNRSGADGEDRRGRGQRSAWPTWRRTRTFRATSCSRPDATARRSAWMRSSPSKIKDSTVSKARSVIGASFTAAPPVMNSAGAWPVYSISLRCWRSIAPAIALAPPLIKASLVLVGKSTTSPVGNFRPAVPISSALSIRPKPGRISPPRKRPSASIASTVAAVPIITTSAGRGGPAASSRARAPTSATQRSAPSRAGWS